jgi:hypothetical protein
MHFTTAKQQQPAHSQPVQPQQPPPPQPSVSHAQMQAEIDILRRSMESGGGGAESPEVSRLRTLSGSNEKAIEVRTMGNHKS